MTPLAAIRLAKSNGFDESLQQIVLAAGDAELAYRFAHDVPGADFQALEAIFLRSHDLRTVYDFAVLKSERGGNIDALQERLLASVDGGLMVLFAIDVAGADIERFEAALNALPDPKYALLLESEKHQRGLE